MSELVTTHYVQQFSTNVELLSQQKVSRFQPYVMTGTHVGKQASPTDQVKPTVAKKRTTRYPDLTPAETGSDRRWVFPSDYDWMDLIDSIDKLRMLIDPTSAYSLNASSAMGRAKDDEIIAAFFGTNKTGQDASTSVTFPSAQQVSASEGASAATGMNVEKLKAAVQILLANEAWDPESGDPIFCAISSIQNRNLMDEIQIINADYNGPKLLEVSGFVRSWGSFKFIHSERLPTNGSSQRRCPVWTKEGMYLGLWQDVKTDLRQRGDLAGLPWQIYKEGTFGSTRLEEAKVVEIPCA